MTNTIKTILMPIQDGTITKNFLRTDFLNIIKAEGNIRIVLLLNQADPVAYEKEFGVPGKVIIETTKVFNENDNIERIFSPFFRHSIPTKFMQIRQMDWYWNEGKYMLYYGATVLRILGGFAFFRKFLRLVSYLEPIDHKVKAVYEKWKPDVLLAATMISRTEVALMHLCKKDGKKIIGIPKSFDNLTSKAFLRVQPDWLIVPNETGVIEAVTLHDYPKERVIPVGICQYDAYTGKDIFEEKETFFLTLGLDPTKKTILYAPAGDWMNPTDHDVLARILKWTEDGTLPHTQVLLRLHPTYESQTEKLAGHKNLVVERPGKHGKNLKAYEFEQNDIKHLASSLAYSDVVINTGSTMMVEASIFDTPVVALGFDGDTNMNYWHSIVRYYDREHLVPIMKTGGVPLVKSYSELKQTLLAYFEDPTLHSEGRKKVVEKICYKMDGKACERTASILLDCVRSV